MLLRSFTTAGAFLAELLRSCFTCVFCQYLVEKLCSSCMQLPFQKENCSCSSFPEGFPVPDLYGNRISAWFFVLRWLLLVLNKKGQYTKRFLNVFLSHLPSLKSLFFFSFYQCIICALVEEDLWRCAVKE